MTPVALILVGSDRPDWLPAASKHAIAHCQTLFADDQFPKDWLDPFLGPTARCVTMTSEPGARASMQNTLVQKARSGESVARLYWRKLCQDGVVLRDARFLRDASVPFELYPSVEILSDSWQDWLGERPLFGRRVAVLRMIGQASDTAELLRERGALPWVVPTIELHPPTDRELLHEALRSMNEYDVVAFTSANGVDRSFEELEGLGLDARALGGCRVAAIGKATAGRLAVHGIRADVIAQEFRGEALAQAILASLGSSEGKRVLVLRALEAREILAEMLRHAGVEVDVVPAYRTLSPSPETLASLRESLAEGRVDGVLLTSSSTVTNLCRALGQGYEELLGNTCLASIGPITTEGARQLGLDVQVEAEPFTIPSVIEALERYFS